MKPGQHNDVIGFFTAKTGGIHHQDTKAPRNHLCSSVVSSEREALLKYQHAHDDTAPSA
jgi:hypothetical protein